MIVDKLLIYGETQQMNLKFVKPEDFVNYKKCSLFLGTCYCDWKCCKENNLPCSICQNYPWSSNPIKNIPNHKLFELYRNNVLMESVVFGGLEPMLQFDEILEFISEFRKQFDDDIVIYTGYYPEEISDKIAHLTKFSNIIVKFGRYIPNKPNRYDDILGITLASDNQYAKKIS